jgi:hypothetical protein
MKYFFYKKNIIISHYGNFEDLGLMAGIFKFHLLDDLNFSVFFKIIFLSLKVKHAIKIACFLPKT